MGLSCGQLQSQILSSKMDSEDFHLVSGAPLREACAAGTMATSGQVAITAHALSACPSLHASPGTNPNFSILTGLRPSPRADSIVLHEKSVHGVRRFVNPHIYSWLLQGYDPRQMMGNRMLTVLFIAHTGTGSLNQWFNSVQAAMLSHGCSIIQVFVCCARACAESLWGCTAIVQASEIPVSGMSPCKYPKWAGLGKMGGNGGKCGKFWMLDGKMGNFLG